AARAHHLGVERVEEVFEEDDREIRIRLANAIELAPRNARRRGDVFLFVVVGRLEGDTREILARPTRARRARVHLRAHDDDDDHDDDERDADLRVTKDELEEQDEERAAVTAATAARPTRRVIAPAAAAARATPARRARSGVRLAATRTDQIVHQPVQIVAQVMEIEMMEVHHSGSSGSSFSSPALRGIAFSSGAASIASDFKNASRSRAASARSSSAFAGWS